MSWRFWALFWAIGAYAIGFSAVYAHYRDNPVDVGFTCPEIEQVTSRLGLLALAYCRADYKDATEREKWRRAIRWPAHIRQVALP